MDETDHRSHARLSSGGVRVFFVNHSVAPVSMGGAERSLLKLVEDWLEADPRLEPFFITKSPRGSFIRELEERDWPFLALRYQGWAVPEEATKSHLRAEFAVRDYNATKRVIEEMARQRPELVVTNTIVAPWGAFAASVLGIPHAWFVREYGDLDHNLRFLTSASETFADISFLSDAIFTNSASLRDYVAAKTGRADVRICYPSIDVSRILQLSEQPLSGDFEAISSGETLRVVQVGRLSPGKGQAMVIKTMATLKDQGLDVHLTLVGSADDETYRKELKALCDSLGVADRVVLYGHADNPFPIVRRADVCVTTSSLEAFGRTTLEYMVLGKPVIATERGGSVELVEHGETGFLFDPEAEEQFASLLTSYALNRELLNRHGENARKRALALTANGSGNAEAINALSALIEEPPSVRKLPHIAQYWFNLPGLVHELGREAMTTPELPSEESGWRARLVRVLKRSDFASRQARRVRKFFIKEGLRH